MILKKCKKKYFSFFCNSSVCLSILEESADRMIQSETAHLLTTNYKLTKKHSLTDINYEVAIQGIFLF